MHLSLDHHDNALKYRASKARTATDPASTPWSADLFGATLVRVPSLSFCPLPIFLLNIFILFI